LGFIVGGHDTTSTTFQWWVKYMGRSQQSQSCLRDALHNSHSTALSENRLPNINEILRTNIPYLDAMIEEAFRYSHIVPFVTREAIVDTQILGHPIPKGTQLLFVTSVESFIKPAFDIDESKRMKRADNSNMQYGVWHPADVAEFKPERWLKMESRVQDGVTVEEEIFDPRSGPTLSFGAGPRGCFGRRLAYLEMRMAMTLLIWSFQFLEMSGSLNDLEAIDTSTEAPKMCYVKLKKIEY
jgi:cytochrome P450